MQSRLVFCLALACGMKASFASPPSRRAAPAPAEGWVAALREGSHTVGRLEAVSIRTTHPYLPDGVSGGWTRVLRDSGATYLRIHFSRFDLAEGDWLEIEGAEGVEPHVYSGTGPAAKGSFWAFTVPGDTAVLTLHALSGGHDGFEIDAYGRGIEPILGTTARTSPASQERTASLSGTIDPGGPEPDPTGLVCGTQDWSDVACYATSHPVDAFHARAAVLAIEGCCTESTAFKVSDTGQFMTSYHARVDDIELRLDYQNSECGGRSAAYGGAVLGAAVLRADPTLDYTFFTTSGDSSGIPCLQLDRRAPAIGERVYIPQHPWGGPKKIAIWSDLDAGGLCAVDPIPWSNSNLIPQTSEIGYFCDTSEGSLGAPVLSGATQRVIGINHLGRCPNSASRMDLIWPQIAGLVDTCSFGFACQPVGGDRCNCDGACSLKETRYIEHGGMCADCWEEPSP